MEHAESIIGDDEMAVVRCGTTAGDVALELYRAWSPNGYEKAVELFELGYYDNSHFFRVVKNFLVQFGITYSTDPELAEKGKQTIGDDPKLDPPLSFQRGFISFAGSGPNSRSSQLFIAYAAVKSLGTQPWETPVGRVVEGMENVESFYGDYGDMPPYGKGPVQGKIHGNPDYISNEFPKLDRFTTCTVHRRPPKQQQYDGQKVDPVLEQVKAGLRSGEEKIHIADTDVAEETAELGGMMLVSTEPLNVGFLVLLVGTILVCVRFASSTARSKKSRKTSLLMSQRRDQWALS